MARIAYGSRDAAAFEATRHVSDQGLAAWRDAVTRHLAPRPGTRLLDLGAGTGMWARAFTDRYDAVDVIAVEPADAMRAYAMRARCPHPRVLAGDAAAIPPADRSVDAAWLSTVVHHFPDLTAAARELRRVLRPGGPVLIRSAFAGRHHAITLFRFFPEAIRVLDTYPRNIVVPASVPPPRSGRTAGCSPEGRRPGQEHERLRRRLSRAVGRSPGGLRPGEERAFGRTASALTVPPGRAARRAGLSRERLRDLAGRL